MKFLNFSKIMLICLMLSSCGTGEKEKTLNELSSEIIPVKIIAVQNLNKPSIINATGLISTENEAKYGFKIGGVVDRILVDEGQSFKKGELLATLKNTEIDAQLSQVENSYQKAKRDYNRVTNLYKDSVATLEQLQNAKTGLDIAKKAVDAVAFNKTYASIYATDDGFVVKKLANEGEIISPGGAVLAINELKANNNWVVKLGVTDSEWASIAVNQKANVTIDAFPGIKFQGFVLRKSLASDQSNGSFQVEIKLTNIKVNLAVGMFAKANIQSNSKSNLPVIPYDALIEADGNTAMVFVPSKNKVKRVPIVIESFNNEAVIVKSGLENYPEIITSNSAFLNERSTIKIIK